MPESTERPLPGLDAASTDRADVLGSAAAVVRGVTRTIGIILVVIGAYYAIQLAGDALSYLRDPATMAPRLEGMMKALAIKSTEIKIGDATISFGRSLGGGMLGFWYFICGWVAFKLIAVGAHLSLAPTNDQRQLAYVLAQAIARNRN